MGLGVFFFWHQTRRFHPFQPAVKVTTIQVLELLSLPNARSVSVGDRSAHNENLPLVAPAFHGSMSNTVESIRTILCAFLGNEWDVAVDCELSRCLDIGHYLYFRLNNGQQVVRPVHDLELNGGFASLHKIRRKMNSQRDNIDPLTHGDSLNISLLLDRSKRAPQEPDLESTHHYEQPAEPPITPVGPVFRYRHGGKFADAYGIGLILGTLFGCIPLGGCGLILISKGRLRVGWSLTVAALLLDVAACASGIIGCLPGSWHKCLCDGEEHSNDSQPFQHNWKIVQQKLLTLSSFRYTVISRGLVMANVLNTDKQIAIIGALAEGSSIRSIERITGVHRDTIMRLGVRVGQGCTALMDDKMRDLTCTRLEMDEIWGFIGKKDRHVREDDDPQLGNVWTWCAIDADTKLVPAFRVGNRDHATAMAFVRDVASRMSNRVQISTDGLNAYVDAIERAFGGDADYGQVIKTYGVETSIQPQRRYSQPEITGIEKKAISGRPDFDLISTSYVERLNATTRLHMKRLARLTHAFSKRRVNFEAAVGLHFAYYNFVRRHSTIRCTPAMAAGVTGSFWSVGDLVEAAA